MTHRREESGGPGIGRVLLVLALGLVGQAACRSAGAPRPPAGPGLFPDAARALVGQLRILRFYGHEESVSLKMQEADRWSGPCDVAVGIEAATFSGGSARFSLQAIGQPRLEGQPREKRGKKWPCRALPASTSLTISGLEGDSAERLTAGVGRVLLTPEDYLHLYGVSFDRPAAPDPKEVADPTLTASPAERKLAASITSPQRRLLAVDPVYRSPNRKVRYEGEVELATVVGADGRLHQTRLVTPLGEHEARVLRVLPLWRYEPARRGDQPVAVRLVETAILRID
jgi:hypothetical protein